jgi:hypothetical protein
MPGRLHQKVEELAQLAAKAEEEMRTTDTKEGMLARSLATGLVVGRCAALRLLPT